ncbi:hypothetical protein yc1106_04584 [Curvularia clavata]|uniref:Xylanolytic transcriptional activator regulatory domain-containing protein n=1 Tax=Curvularia clavata TaxID=95742 RepID=A0A9Q8Z7X8_CURCL|nr:hypothetical protein yc1106_04584 [Curvularia clavata]
MRFLREISSAMLVQPPPALSNAARRTRAASRFPFLLSYTAAETGEPSEFAKALETLRSNSENAAPQNEFRVGDEPIHSFPGFTRLFAADFFQLDAPQGSSSLLEFLPQPTPDSDAHEDVLRSRVSDLVVLLKQGTRSSLFHDVIINLLTPTNLGLCIENFFQYAYRHVPIVHKPSFVVANAESSLLLSVFVVGAIWSYPRDTYFMVLDVIELVEQCIFESSLFISLRGPTRSSLNPHSPGVLSLLQAATMIVSISLALPNADHRQRFRSQRFTDLVSATRLLRAGAEKTSHTWTNINFEWTEYIISESCSRVVYYVYLLDCHISTIYAVLPRVSVLEMQASLPSNESTFGAENAEICQERLSSDLAAPQYSLVNLVQKLMAVESTGLELCRLTAFPLFLTIEALQTMIFTAKTQLLDTFQPVCFERALKRWKALWDNCQDIQTLSKEVGFMVHAEEVWLLAQKVLKSDASRLISRFGVNDMAQVRQWLTELD